MTPEDREIAAGCVRMRGQDAWSLACMRARGEEQRARDYLESVNRCRRIWGAAEFAMPEPAITGTLGTVKSHGRGRDLPPELLPENEDRWVA